MFWNHIENHWGRYKTAIKYQWPLLTEGEMNDISGSHELLILCLQRRYGYTRREAQGEIETFMRHIEENGGRLPGRHPEGLRLS